MKRDWQENAQFSMQMYQGIHAIAGLEAKKVAGDAKIHMIIKTDDTGFVFTCGLRSITIPNEYIESNMGHGSYIALSNRVKEVVRDLLAPVLA